MSNRDQPRPERGSTAASAEVPAHLDPAHTPDLLAEDSVLFSLLRGIASTSGMECFRAITQHLAGALGVPYAVVAEFRPETRRVRTLAFWSVDRFRENAEWELPGTPCEEVINGRFCLHPQRLRELFPLDRGLVTMRAESYLGVPLTGPRGTGSTEDVTLGHLFVMDTRPMPPQPRNLAIFRVFAARATSELVRLRGAEELAASERRFRTVLDMSMDAVVAADASHRVVIFNSAAESIFGCTRADAIGQPLSRFLLPALMEQVPSGAPRGAAGEGPAYAVLPAGLSAQRWGGGAFPVEGTVARQGSGEQVLVTLTVRDVSERERTTRRLEALRHENAALRESSDIVGASPVLVRVLESAKVVARTDTTVLIEGETGTGKELIARSIHEQSPRAGGPFVKVNCAALPAGLVESEFFGHEKGAFTGAVNSRRGRFELADGGTIFLDEVGEVAPDVQVKLLRVLQESEFERVGGSQTIRVNVRVIAATNRDLGAEVQAQRFRADLYYRLSVFPVRVPALRERIEDIPSLASHFVRTLGAALGKRVEEIEPATLERLQRYGWPGNIRELRNVLERAVILSTGPRLRIEEAELGAVPRGEAAGAATTLVSLADKEREYIEQVLRRTGGAIAGPKGAAKILGLAPSTLRSRMEKLGMRG